MLLSGLYREALEDLSDSAWLSGCKAAIRNCRHFPTPIEIRELAEAYAETIIRERVAAADQLRIATAEDAGRKMIAAGRITEEQIERNADVMAEMSAATLDAIRSAGIRAEARDDFWSQEARDRVRRYRHLNGRRHGA
jgi:hypothetical protein